MAESSIFSDALELDVDYVFNSNTIATVQRFSTLYLDENQPYSPEELALEVV